MVMEYSANRGNKLFTTYYSEVKNDKNKSWFYTKKQIMVHGVI